MAAVPRPTNMIACQLRFGSQTQYHLLATANRFDSIWSLRCLHGLLITFPQAFGGRKNTKKPRINCQAAIAAPILKSGMSTECVSVTVASAKYTKSAKLKEVSIFMWGPFRCSFIAPQISKTRAKIGPGNVNKVGSFEKKTDLEIRAVRTG